MASVKRSRASRGRFFSRLGAAIRRMLQPRHALPCVGLVVLGGCLTLVVLPDDPTGVKDLPEAAPNGSSMPTIVVDPGHGGKDDGTKWRGVSEKDMTLDLAVRLERILRQAGFPTLLTRRDNTFVSLEQRTRVANQVTDAIFVSLHFNSDPTGVSSGIETYFARQKESPSAEWTWVGLFNRPEPVENDTSEVLAGAVQSALLPRTQARNRGIHPANYYVIHHTRCPAILVEGGFLSNLFEAQMLGIEQYRETMAQGIAEGVMTYQKMRSQPGGIPPTQPRLADLAP